MWLKYAVIVILCYIKYSEELPDKGSLFNSRSLLNPLLDSNSKISGKCKEHLKEYEAGLRKGKMWALEMLDASAKFPPSGILHGNLVMLGDFDMCLNASYNNEIFGKYCLGGLPLPVQDKSNIRNLATPETRMVTPDGKPSVMFAICLPDSCSAEDFQEYNKGLIELNFSENLCSSKSSTPPLSGGDIATISFLGVVLYVMLMSTVYEALIYYMKKKQVHPILAVFSVITNTKKLLQTTNDPGQISCLHGIRVLSMMWVILGHRYSIDGSMPVVNITSFVDEWIHNWESMIIMGATVSVDTFFLLGGLLVAYAFLLATSKGFKFNIFIYYFHRFLRLTPLLAVIILIHTTIIKHLGSGPLWNYVITGLSKNCEKYWWSTLLYVQNFVNPEETCMGQSWYLSVDTQLFLLSPLILLPLKYRPKIGISLTGILTICSIVTCFVVGWIDELHGFIVANMLKGDVLMDYMNHYYIQTHTRAGPWLMGIILGYIVFEIKQKNKKISVNSLLSILLWITSLVILCACVFTGQNMLEDTYVYDRFTNALYLAFLRPGWSLGVSWVIFACIIEHGGPVNWFLSLPMFQVASKLTYSMYLVHMSLMYILSAQTRVVHHFSNLELLYAFWGDFAFTFGAGLLFTLAFESPIIAIEKVIFGKKEKRSPEKEHDVVQVDRIEKIEIS